MTAHDALRSISCASVGAAVSTAVVPFMGLDTLGGLLLAGLFAVIAWTLRPEPEIEIVDAGREKLVADLRWARKEAETLCGTVHALRESLTKARGETATARVEREAWRKLAEAVPRDEPEPDFAMLGRLRGYRTPPARTLPRPARVPKAEADDLPMPEPGRGFTRLLRAPSGAAMAQTQVVVVALPDEEGS